MPSVLTRTCLDCGDSIDIRDDFYGSCDSCCAYWHDGCQHCDCGYDDDYDDDGCDCSDCRPYNNVRPWNYRPPFRFKGDPSDPMLGVELEVGGSQRTLAQAVRRTDDSEDHLYLKREGSISGVEIVTHPMTLDYAHSYPFPGMLQDLRDVGAYVGCEYGLHVHVSRDSFTRIGKKTGRRVRSARHQMAWLLFIYRNRTALEALARRDPSSWGAFHTPGRSELRQKAYGPRSEERYLAVNCNNTATYELRFFQSTLDETEFYAAIEFADASVNYTRALTTADVLHRDALSWSRFGDWAVTDRPRYRHLLRELDRIGEHETARGTHPVEPPRPRRASSRPNPVPRLASSRPNPVPRFVPRSEPYSDGPMPRSEALLRAVAYGGRIAREGHVYDVRLSDEENEIREMRLCPLDSGSMDWVRESGWVRESVYVSDGWYAVSHDETVEQPF